MGKYQLQRWWIKNNYSFQKLYNNLLVPHWCLQDSITLAISDVVVVIMTHTIPVFHCSNGLLLLWKILKTDTNSIKEKLLKTLLPERFFKISSTNLLCELEIHNSKSRSPNNSHTKLIFPKSNWIVRANLYIVYY